jgi:hypothetical protein
MNDPETLAVYTQLVVFRGNGSMSELIIRDPDHPKQNILCNLAHSLDLEYEYDLNLKKARISRGPQIDHDSLLTDKPSSRMRFTPLEMDFSMLHTHDSASINSFSSRGSTSGSASSSIHSSRSNRSFNSARGGYFSSFKAGSEASSLGPRSGPLGEITRATARAVKSVKACWRCKILRKKVGYRFNWTF